MRVRVHHHEWMDSQQFSHLFLGINEAFQHMPTTQTITYLKGVSKACN